MGDEREVERIRERALERIESGRIAGRDTRHNRRTNLEAISRLVEGHPHYTFGIHDVQRFTAQEVLDAVAGVTKCSRDLNYTSGGGYISPAATLKTLEAAAQRTYQVARQGGSVVVATGHPGSLLLYYIELVRLLRTWGATVLEVERGALVPPNLDLDYIEGVAVTTDRCSLPHTHDHAAMDHILAAAGHVDLVVADHGYAGAAINARVPTITTMDTNDPAVAVAQRYLDADVTVIPLDDNRPPFLYLPLAESFRELAEAHTAAWGEAPQPARTAQQDGAVDGLAEAERIVRERLGDPAALDQFVGSFLRGYKDQFLQTRFHPEDEDALIANPDVTLAIYGVLREAIDQFIIEQVHHKKADLAPAARDRCTQRLLRATFPPRRT
ncbi:MAG: phosphatase [Chloroflexi bacterium]|nr:phosphatase [Chloroflexota bacterium]